MLRLCSHGGMDLNEYARFDAIGLAELVREREVTPLELVDAALARIDALNPRLNAVVVRFDGKARRAADHPVEGPLAGVPFLVKDMDGVLGGESNTSSSRSLVDWRPAEDSELFARYKRAGLIIVGKTNCPEFGIMGVTEPEMRGPTHNPWDLDRTPGGSSGGSAAAVAARIVPVAHAGDGGGSIRIPASCCGLFGLKPTRGRMPLGPYLTEGWDGFVVPNVVSRSVRDTAAILDATHGTDPGAPYAEPPAPKSFLSAARRHPGRLRIGFSNRAMLGSKTHPDCDAAVRDAVILLRELGHELVEIDMPGDPEDLARTYLTVVAACVAADVLRTEQLTGKAPKPEMFELPTWFLRQAGDELSARELEQARQRSQRLGREVARVFDDNGLDAHLSATMAFPPSRIGELQPSVIERVQLHALRLAAPGRVLRLALQELASKSLERVPNTQVFNMTGQPAMNVPLWWNDEGLPIGVQFAGRFGDEATLLRLATQLEQARPWAEKLPEGARC